MEKRYLHGNHGVRELIIKFCVLNQLFVNLLLTIIF